MTIPDVTAIEELLPYLTQEEEAELTALLFPSVSDYSPYAKLGADRFGEDFLLEQYTDDIKKVMRSVRDNPITIAESANAVGKSHGAARIVVWAYKSYEKLGPQIYTAAAPPIENLERILWGEIHSITRKNPALFANDNVPVGMNITSRTNPKSFIVGVTIPKAGSPAEREAAFSGKHAPYLLFVLDEADAIPVEVYKGIESCISGGKGHLLLMYNPRSEGGYVAELKAAGAPVIKLSAFDHPNVRDGIDYFPGAVTRNKTIHRIWQWTVEAQYAEHMVGYGRFTLPQFLVGQVGYNEFNKQPYDPLPPGERVIIKPDFAYMVLGVYAGVNEGTVYDVWTDRWDEYVAAIRAKKGAEAEFAFLQAIVNGDPLETRGMATVARMPRDPLLPELLRGNVTPFADYIPGAGPVFWSMDDGYIGQIDPQTMTFTGDSHPRVVGFYQLRNNGDLVRFDELYMVREPKAERQIEKAIAKPYPRPEYVTIGPGSASLRGNLEEAGFYTRHCAAEVEESVKELRDWIAADDRGHRRFLVHPRCVHYRYEMKMYRRDDKLRIIKAFDHGPDESRYIVWLGRNGF